MSDQDRFDLEQNIMQCWNVVEDLNLLLEQGTVTEENVKAVATLYTQKFEYLWQNFENCCANKFGYFPELPNELSDSKQTYGITEE
jgi:NADH:ubiquinone oxidoreductase subunit B-like Fe-S oxidoreductase